ncbi:MAG: NAD-dependent epimerase/dehydratase [Bacteroidales bacterium]|nr:NAD-dependent epimerase/dehydratase [Bacteroidales bacterium]
MIKSLTISGATSMLGIATIKTALKCGYSIICIIRKNSSRKKKLLEIKNENLEIVECDLKDYCNLDLKKKSDVFIHFAWDKTSATERDDVDIQLDNIKYTLDAVRLAARLNCKVFIGAGSQAEYGIQTEKLTPELPCNPESGYGIAKFSAGKFSKMLCKQLGIRFNWLRILSVYGIGDGKNTLISYIIETLKKGESPLLTPCTQTWDYLFSEEAAKAILCVSEKGIDGKVYPLGSGIGRKLSTYVEEIRDLINPEIPLKFASKPFYPHQPMYLVADVSALKNDTGWQNETDFINGIKKILNS